MMAISVSSVLRRRRRLVQLLPLLSFGIVVVVIVSSHASGVDFVLANRSGRSFKVFRRDVTDNQWIKVSEKGEEFVSNGTEFRTKSCSDNIDRQFKVVDVSCEGAECEEVRFVVKKKREKLCEWVFAYARWTKSSKSTSLLRLSFLTFLTFFSLCRERGVSP